MSRPGMVRVSEEEFHRLWNEFAEAGKTKEDLRVRLGLNSTRPLDTRRARLEAKGLTFAKLATGTLSTSSVTPEAALRDQVRDLTAQLKAAQRDQLDAHHVNLIFRYGEVFHRAINLPPFIRP
jgi:hypothetical protein